MKAKNVLILSALLACATAFAEHDYQTSQNGIGDWNLLTLGGYTFTKKISVDLSPANAPNEDARYSVRCQVIYKDNSIPRPMSDDELKTVRKTGDDLRKWLQEFISSECAGRDYENLFSAYISGKFAENLNEHFPAYVAEQIAALDPDERPDIDAVTVTVEAEGAFMEELFTPRNLSVAE